MKTRLKKNILLILLLCQVLLLFQVLTSTAFAQIVEYSVRKQVKPASVVIANETVTSYAGLTTAIFNASTSGVSTGIPYVIEIGDNIDVTNFTIDAGKNIIIRSQEGENYALSQTSAVTGRHFTVYGNLTIKDITLKGQTGSGGIKTYAGSYLTLQDGAVIENCNPSETGGGVNASGNFKMDGGIIRNNKVSSSGANVYVSNTGSFTMNSGIITNGTANNFCGGVYTSGTFLMNGGEIVNNTGFYNTGGVYVTGATGRFTMNDGIIRDNKESGVIVYNSGTFFMNGGEIKGNTSSSSGAGVYVSAGNVIMDGGKIIENKSTSTTNNTGGGGVFIAGNGRFTMNNGKISNNRAANWGGGMLVYGDTSSFTMNNGEINDNISGSSGGGVLVCGSNGRFSMNGGTINGNTATKNGGGVVLYVNTAAFLMNSGEISGNQAMGTTTSSGGGIYTSGRFEMTGGTISNNEAIGSTSSANGGGIYVNAVGTASISGESAITGNSALNGHGGGIYTANAAYSNITTAITTTFSGNRALVGYIPPR